MIKILQDRRILQQYVNHELPDVQAGFRKSRGTIDHIARIRWIIEKAREFQKKKIYFCFTDYALTRSKRKGLYNKSLQLCPTLCDPMDCSPLNSVQGILRERILEWVAMPSSRGISQTRDQICASYVSCIGRRVLYP